MWLPMRDIRVKFATNLFFIRKSAIHSATILLISKGFLLMPLNAVLVRHTWHISGSTSLLFLVNPRLRACAAEGYCSRSVCVCVCVCVRVSVRLSTVFLGNRGNSERETWTYYQVGGMHGK